MNETMRCKQFYLGNSGLGVGASLAKHLISMGPIINLHFSKEKTMVSGVW